MTDLFEIDFNERNATGELIWYSEDNTMDEYLEQQNDEEAYAAHIETARKPYNVHCELCSATDFAPEKTLRARGWQLDRGGEWCDVHSGA